MGKRRVVKRTAIALAIVIAVYLVSSAVATAVIPRFLFPRSDGTTRFSLAYSEDDAAEYPRERFSFVSCGRTLYGYYYPAERAKGLVVVVNGIYNGESVRLPHIKAFHDDGWAVATYDGTGVGESEGDGVGGLAQMKLDLFAFLDFARGDGRLSALQTVLFGHSAGAYASACALAHGYGIRAAVLIAGFDAPLDVMTYHARRVGGIFTDIEYPFMLLWHRIAFGADGNESAREALSSTSVPTLLVGAASDDTVPCEVGLTRFRDEYPDCVEVVEIGGPRGEHSTTWLTEEAAEYVNGAADGAVDRERANELDPGFLSRVLALFDGAVR